MSVEINEDFAAALREMLVAHVHTSEQRRHRLLRWPRTIGLKLALAGVVVAAGGGAAAATGVISIPGSTLVTELAPAVTVTGTGTETISLGTPPQGASSLNLTFSCLTPGNFMFGDGGAGETCAEADLQHSTQSTGTLPLARGQDTIIITADTGDRWRATVFYSSTTRTPYKTNANGQTYGTDGGAPAGPLDEPDLVAVQATNGKVGYAYATQLNGRTPTSPAKAVAENNQPARMIPVYQSDGRTQIGQFKVGN
jgi:hypothetical protein